jgi:Protein of unknown function (DUF1236)
MKNALFTSVCAIAFAASLATSGHAQDAAGQEKMKSEKMSPTDKTSPGDHKPRQVAEPRQSGTAESSSRAATMPPGDHSKDAQTNENQTNQKMNRKADEKSRPDTDRAQNSATPHEGAEKPQNQANQPGERHDATGHSSAPRRDAIDKTGTGADDRSTGEANLGRDRGKLDERQAADLRGRLKNQRGAGSASLDFKIRMGSAIPETVEIRELPSEVVVDYPQFRGYDFVVVQDQIVIVDPRSREVVEVLGGPEGRAAAESEPRRRFTREQDDLIRNHLHRDRSARFEFNENAMRTIPDTVALEPLPDEVVSIVPDFDGYRYFVDNNDHIIVVDPRTHEVVEVID